MKKKIILISIISFLVGGLLFGSISLVIAVTYRASDVSYKSPSNTWNVSNVEGAINDLYDKATTFGKSSYTYLGSTYSWDSHYATVEYTAPKDMTILALGFGGSTENPGNTYVNISTTGTYDLVRNDKSGSKPFGTSIIYVVKLKKNDTLSFSTYSGQGHTVNYSILYEIN